MNVIDHSTVEARLMHNALDKLISSVTRQGHKIDKIANVSLTKRFNNNSGMHVHATCSIKLRFDESVCQEVEN